MGTWHWLGMHLQDLHEKLQFQQIWLPWVKSSHALCIKTSSSEQRGQEEVASTCVFRPMRPLQCVIYTDGWSKFLKCCSSAAVTATAVYYRPSTTCCIELIAEQSIKLALPFLETSQSMSFGACFHDNSQQSSYRCNNV